MNRVGPQRSPLGLVAVSSTAGAGVGRGHLRGRDRREERGRPGGLDAWRKVRGRWCGLATSKRPRALPRMQFKLEQKPAQQDTPAAECARRQSVRAFDGMHGWKLRPPRRPEVSRIRPQEFEVAQAGHGIDGPLID